MTSREQTGVLERDQPIEIAPRLWWVGHYLEGDPFQCHTYLLEQGDQSVLFDPGSALTVAQTLRKIEKVVPFEHIRYFVCHHQDPDITGAMPHLDRLITRDDALLVTHWRARVLLRHLGLDRLTFWNVEEHDWTLQLDDRTLKFVFTPYAHFPGAFVTFDPSSGTLLSSDLFGGFTEGFQLYAQDESYFESMRPFHEHYIPSREVMHHVLNSLDVLPIRQIAPQHGSIIVGDLVRYVMSRLRELECGLYLIAGEDTDVLRLARLNRLLRDVTSTLLKSQDFKTIARELAEIASTALPVEGMAFYAHLSDGSHVLMAPEARYRAQPVELPHQVELALRDAGGPQPTRLQFGGWRGAPGVLVPLCYGDDAHASAVAVIKTTAEALPGDESLEALTRIAGGLAVAVERESIHLVLAAERERMYEASVRDPLTKLFTRRHLTESFPT